MAVDGALAERVRTAARDHAARQGLELCEKHMFGGLAIMLDDKMACGVAGDELMVRVGPEAYEAALAEPHVREMDFTGRPMRGYVFVEAAGCTTLAAVERWVAQSAAYVQDLAPRPRASRRRGRRHDDAARPVDLGDSRS